MILPSIAIFEFELLLAAFLAGHASGEALRAGITENRGTVLFVDQDTGLFLRHTAGDGGKEALIDYALGVGNFSGLGVSERWVPAEHFGLE